MKKIPAAFLISFAYFIVSFLWILFSDKAILLFTNNNELITNIQTIKGWFFISVTSIFLYFLITKALRKEKYLKDFFKRSLDNLASPIIIFNEDGKVLTINKTFENLTGYTYDEIDTTDKWANKAYGRNAKDVMKEIDALYATNHAIDSGIYHIRTKSGKTIIWNFYSAPFGIENGKRTIISNAIDITEIKTKERLLIQQSKMATMGEVLENIAHQWRQPLSSISTISTGIGLKNELTTLEKDEIDESMKLINDSVQYLSKTIDDFRSFSNPTKEKTKFNIHETFDKSLLVIGSKFRNEKIEFINDIDDIEIINDNNALIQVFINIFNNSKDAFNENNLTDKLIFIKTKLDNKNLIIEITDNAGGIDKEIIDKIFEPYVTTKTFSLGTGIGLYMSEEIIVKHMEGDIKVENTEFKYNNKTQKGAKFIITLPLKLQETSKLSSK